MSSYDAQAVTDTLHAIEQQLCRWLLMSGDRLGSDEFLLTQDFISNMLGVRREGVSKAAGVLQQNELINYSRGRLKLLDPAGLEAVSCECYGIIKGETDGYLGKS